MRGRHYKLNLAASSPTPAAVAAESRPERLTVAPRGPAGPGPVPGPPGTVGHRGALMGRAGRHPVSRTVAVILFYYANVYNVSRLFRFTTVESLSYLKNQYEGQSNGMAEIAGNIERTGRQGGRGGSRKTERSRRSHMMAPPRHAETEAEESLAAETSF